MKKLFFSLVFIAGLSAYTFAQTVTPVIRERRENQHGRIQEGVRDGSLTRREAARLRYRTHETHENIKDAKADGIITQGERATIRKEQAQNSRAIYRQKHDGQYRRRL